MIRKSMRRLAALLAPALAVFLTAAPANVCAQGASEAKYPSKSIKLIVPFAAGGSNDIVGRYIAIKLGERLGQTVVADNKAGANSIIGSHFVSEAPPDGYTLLIISNAFATNPAVYKKLPYDPLKGFTPIAQIGTGPNVIAVWPGLGVNSVKDLVALAKAKPGELHYASSGLGGVHNFTGELFKAATGTDITHVAYKGGGQGMIDVMSGQVEVLVNTVASALGHIKSGKLKALAVDSLTRSTVLPDVPTLAETVPGYEGNAVWWGIVGPPNMPTPIVALLNREINAVLKEPEVVKWLLAQSAETEIGTPDAFGKRLTSDLAKYKAIAKAANIRID